MILQNFSQVFVETLDRCFENVCELDLIFHYDKVRNQSIPYFLSIDTVGSPHSGWIGNGRNGIGDEYEWDPATNSGAGEAGEGRGTVEGGREYGR